jgi:outer membrane cobalamin receptor
VRRLPFLLVLAASPASADEVIEVIDRAPAGAETSIDDEQLERREQDDIHKILSVVAGVYVRDEDGYGLRPNIGMRGAAAERSAKITLLEDGVPIAPAPYSAPAAYYFPMVTRMARVEVTKGPASILQGPNTVGGVVDLQSPRARRRSSRGRTPSAGSSISRVSRSPTGAAATSTSPAAATSTARRTGGSAIAASGGP